MELLDYNFLLKPLHYGKGKAAYPSGLLQGGKCKQHYLTSSLDLCIYIYIGYSGFLEIAKIILRSCPFIFFCLSALALSHAFVSHLTLLHVACGKLNHKILSIFC